MYKEMSREELQELVSKMSDAELQELIDRCDANQIEIEDVELTELEEIELGENSTEEEILEAAQKTTKNIEELITNIKASLERNSEIWDWHEEYQVPAMAAVLELRKRQNRNKEG